MLEPGAWIYAVVRMSWWAYTTGQQLKLWLQVTGAFNWISVLFPYDSRGAEVFLIALPHWWQDAASQIVSIEPFSC